MKDKTRKAKTRKAAAAKKAPARRRHQPGEKTCAPASAGAGVA
jgi:hypothetical protein